jgi:hypothetical protein
MQGCIGEYERIKRRESTAFRTVKDFCLYHGFSHRNFMTIYHRYRQHHCPAIAWIRVIVHAAPVCKPENELSIFAGRATTAMKYGVYCGKMLPLFPAQQPSAAGDMD